MSLLIKEKNDKIPLKIAIMKLIIPLKILIKKFKKPFLVSEVKLPNLLPIGLICFFI